MGLAVRMSGRKRGQWLRGVAVVVALLTAATVGGQTAEPNYCWWRPTCLGLAPSLTATAGMALGPVAKLRVEEITPKEKSTIVTTTGSRVEVGWLLLCSQRLPVERDRLVVLGIGPVASVERIDDFTCQMEGGYASLTYQGDSVLIIKAKLDVTIDLLVVFKPEYQAQVKGGILAMDAEGGFGIFATDDGAFQGQKRPTFWGSLGMSFGERDAAGRAQFCRTGKAKAADGTIAQGPQWQKDFGELSYRLKTGQELWLAIFPPQPPPTGEAFGAAVGKPDNPYEDAPVDRAKLSPAEYEAYRQKKSERYNRFTPYPGNEILRLVNPAAFLHHAGLQRDLRTQTIVGPLYRNGGSISFRQTNALKVPLPIALKWDAPGWQVSPPAVALTPEPNAVAEATFTFGPSPAGPPPKLLVTYELPGVDGKAFTQTQVFAMPVNETTAVPRLPALDGLDAVARALKDQPPRLIRAENQDLAELRLAVAGDRLAVSALVRDDRCRPDIPQWTHAIFDVYLSRPGSTQIRQFSFQPSSPKGDQIIIFNENGRKCGDAQFPARVVAAQPAGYEVHALIPLQDGLLTADTDRFLLDAAVVAGRGTFNLLYTGEPGRCAYRNNRYFALALVPARPPPPPAQ